MFTSARPVIGPHTEKQKTGRARFLSPRVAAHRDTFTRAKRGATNNKPNTHAHKRNIKVSPDTQSPKMTFDTGLLPLSSPHSPPLSSFLLLPPLLLLRSRLSARPGGAAGCCRTHPSRPAVCHRPAEHQRLHRTCSTASARGITELTCYYRACLASPVSMLYNAIFMSSIMFASLQEDLLCHDFPLP